VESLVGHPICCTEYIGSKDPVDPEISTVLSPVTAISRLNERGTHFLGEQIFQ
jgi:hypothetical protein